MCWFVRQQLRSSWNRSKSIGFSQHPSRLQVSCIRGKAKDLTSATRSPLNMFFGLLYPLLFELSALIPDPAFSQGLLDAFTNAYLFLFSVLEH